MTHRGPFQPQPFCDSVILYALEVTVRAGGASQHVSTIKDFRSALA